MVGEPASQGLAVFDQAVDVVEAHRVRFDQIAHGTRRASVHRFYPQSGLPCGRGSE